MKFFTIDCYNGNYSNGEEDALDKAFKSYTRHLEAMQGILPADVLALAKLSGVDDGLVIEVRYQRLQKLLRLVLRCGDLQMGYYDLILIYEDASMSSQDERTLARLAQTTQDHQRHESDLAYHEVDKTEDGGIEHRFLFHPGVCFTICCGALRWARMSRPDRLLPHLPDRFSSTPIIAP